MATLCHPPSIPITTMTDTTGMCIYYVCVFIVVCVTVLSVLVCSLCFVWCSGFYRLCGNLLHEHIHVHVSKTVTIHTQNHGMMFYLLCDIVIYIHGPGIFTGVVPPDTSATSVAVLGATLSSSHLVTVSTEFTVAL